MFFLINFKENITINQNTFIMKKLFIATASLALLLPLSCSKDETTEIEPVEPEVTQQDELTIENSLDNLVGDHLDSHFEVIEYPDGTKKESITIGDDGVMPEEQFNEIVEDYKLALQAKEEGKDFKQFRTNNLVNLRGRSTRTIRILGLNQGDRKLSQREINGLYGAVNMYNELGLRIKFNITLGRDQGGFDIVVRRRFIKGYGGKAQFPRNGNPGTFIYSNSQTGDNKYSYNAIKHLMAHEIGHCIGMRHNDWMNRITCNKNKPKRESSANGNIYITGPRGADRSDGGSIFNACVPTRSTNGNFNRNDRNFLYTLYGF